MEHPTFSRDEIARQGQGLYQTQLRPLVETEANIGKIISIDVATGDYEIADDVIAASRLLKARHPDAVLWSERIGYNAVFAVGGTLTRTSA
jgi:hypothetical protein